MTEICEKFATSEARKKILEGFLNLREECRSRRISGFQWIAGSFTDRIEILENRDPKDIDVVTFVRIPELENEFKRILKQPTDLKDLDYVYQNYLTDCIFLPLKTAPSNLVKALTYFCGLYSHRRDGTWKGLLSVDLPPEPDGDAEARIVLESKP